MRRLVAALVMVTVAVSLAACGGGSTPAPAAAPTVAPPAGAPAPVAAPAAPQAGHDPLALSVRLDGTGTPIPSATGGVPGVPPVIIDHVGAHMPMIVYFYDAKQRTTVDQDSEITAAMKDYRGLIDLVRFDITVALPSSGASANTTEAKQAQELADQIGVAFTPYLVIVDKNGIMTARFRGFVDRDYLQREIQRAIR